MSTMRGWTVSAGSALAVVALIGGGAVAVNTLGDEPDPEPKQQQPAQLVEPVEPTVTVAEETTTLEPEPTATTSTEPTVSESPTTSESTPAEPAPAPSETTEEPVVTPKPETTPEQPVEPIKPERDGPIGSPDGPTPGPPDGGIVSPAP